MLRGGVEEGEVTAALFEGPAGLLVAQGEGVGDAADGRVVVEHGLDPAAVAGIPGDELGPVGDLGGTGVFDQGQGLLDDGGGLEGDEQVHQLDVGVGGFGGEKRVELGDDFLAGFAVRFAEADEIELPGAEPAEELAFVERRGIHLKEGGGEFRAVGLRVAAAGEGDGSGDAGLGRGGGEDLVGPGGDGLRLDRDAGGVAEEAVGAGEVGQGLGHGGGILLAMESLEFATEGAGLGDFLRLGDGLVLAEGGGCRSRDRGRSGCCVRRW